MRIWAGIACALTLAAVPACSAGADADAGSGADADGATHDSASPCGPAPGPVCAGAFCSGFCGAYCCSRCDTTGWTPVFVQCPIDAGPDAGVDAGTCAGPAPGSLCADVGLLSCGTASYPCGSVCYSCVGGSWYPAVCECFDAGSADVDGGLVAMDASSSGGDDASADAP